MALEYSRSLLRVAVAQICQSLGWNAVQTTPMELLTDVLERYLFEMGKQSQRYAGQFGRTEANLDDLALALSDLGVNLSELEDYVQHVDPVPFAVEVPRFPVPKECLLHIPKPKSRELLHREEHVHEHLPPMHQEWEEEIELPVIPEATVVPADVGSVQGSIVPLGGSQEKRPNENPSDDAPPSKKPKILPEEAGPSSYEMKSVIMSKSGLLSSTPGILPDARTPPPPTPQTPKPGPLVFPVPEVEPQTPRTPSAPKPSLTVETVSVKTEYENVDMENVCKNEGHVDDVDIGVEVCTPRSPRIASKSPRGQRSPKGRSPRGGRSPKGSPRTPIVQPPLVKSPVRGGKSSRGGRSPKTKPASIKKIKTPKVIQSTKGDVTLIKSPKRGRKRGGKSPGRPRGSPGRSPGRGRSPRRASVSIPDSKDSILSEHQGFPDETSLPTGILPLEPNIEHPKCIDSKIEPTLQNEDIVIKEEPIITEKCDSEFIPSPVSVKVTTSELEAKETRLASYDDAIDSVVSQCDVNVSPKVKIETVEPSSAGFEIPDYAPPLPVPPSPRESAGRIPKEEKKKKVKRERKVSTASDQVITDIEKDTPTPTQEPDVPAVPSLSKDIYDFDDDFDTSTPPPFSPPVDVLTKFDKKKEKSKKKKKKLKLKIPENVSVPSGEDSDASKTSGIIRSKSFSPSSPKVILDKMTPEDIEKLSYSPEKKVPPSPRFIGLATVKEEETTVQPPISKITIDIRQPKLIIKIPKDDSKSEKEMKKDKKKKKNKDKDRERDKSKDKKDKYRDKEKKRDKKDKEKKDKEKLKDDHGEMTTVGGSGFPKLTLKFGGLKTAKPTISIPSRESSPPPPQPKQDALKLVIKPFAESPEQKTEAASPSPPQRIPTPSPTRIPSPSPPRILTPSPSAHIPTPSPLPAASSSLPSTRCPTPATENSLSPSPTEKAPPSPFSPRSPVHSPVRYKSRSRSRSHSPMPLLPHNSPIGMAPDFTFSPSPSPTHFSLPPTRSPSPDLAPSPAPSPSPSPAPAPVPAPAPASPPKPETPVGKKKKQKPGTPGRKRKGSPGKAPPKTPPKEVVRAPVEEEEVDEGEESDSESIAGGSSVSVLKEEHGEQIWICPACNMQDDGSPMIGCDKCDDWYHWPCVGIKKEPPENQDWYCPRCRIAVNTQSAKPDKKHKKGRPGRPGKKKTKKKV